LLIACAGVLLAASAAHAAQRPSLINSTNNVGFGDVAVGVVTEPTVVTARNDGDAPLVITAVTAITSTGPDGSFVLGSDSCSGRTFAPGETCSVETKMHALAVGTAGGTVKFESNDPDGDKLVFLNGNGIDAPHLHPAPAAMTATAYTGFSSDAVLIAYDDAEATLHVSTVTIADDANGVFAIDFENCAGATIQHNEHCILAVRFGPSATGTYTADVRFASDDPTSPTIVPITGTAIDPPVAGASPDVIDFGNVEAGTKSAPQTVTITNTGAGTLVVRNWFVQTDQAEIVSQTCAGARLQPDDSCEIVVRFAPAFSGEWYDALEVETNDPHNDGQTEVPMSGVGFVDDTPPVSSFVTPDLSVLLAGQAAITGTITDDLSGVAGEALEFVPVVPGAPRTAALVPACTTPRACTWSSSIPADMTPGVYTVRAHGTDAAGNAEAPGHSIRVVVL
jgi:hypothetical protein